MDSYQPIFDAVRSQIGSFNGQDLIDAIAYKFECSQQLEIIYQEAMNVHYQQQRPSVLFKPTLTIDGNQWCALYGKDLQSGVAGFGDSPNKAMLDFDEYWTSNLKTIREK